MNRPQVVVILLIGLALGVAGSLVTPKVARRYLPEAIVGTAEGVDGTVLAKNREADRLLLTVGTDHGAVLITFRKKVAEIALLVEPGDTVTLGLPRYEPFVEDPAIRRVRKRKPGRPPDAEAGSAPPVSPGEGVSADTSEQQSGG